MKIISVEYRRLRTFGNYENETIGATAYVGLDESPDETLESLKSWVESKHSDRDEAEEIRNREKILWGDLGNEIRDREHELASLKARRDNAVALLQKHGVNTKELEEIPF